MLKKFKVCSRNRCAEGPRYAQEMPSRTFTAGSQPLPSSKNAPQSIPGTSCAKQPKIMKSRSSDSSSACRMQYVESSVQIARCTVREFANLYGRRCQNARIKCFVARIAMQIWSRVFSVSQCECAEPASRFRLSRAGFTGPSQIFLRPGKRSHILRSLPGSRNSKSLNQRTPLQSHPAHKSPRASAHSSASKPTHL